MSDAIETYGDMATFASRRVPAWHLLGTVFEDDVTTQEMLDLAHLSGWDVHLEEIVTPYPYFRTEFWVVRTNPFYKTKEILGSVGERYNEYQNEELFAFGDNIVHGGGRWETAGSIKNGTQVFASMALEYDQALQNGDEISSYLLLNTGHDGSMSVMASVTPVRVVCANTLNIGIAQAKSKFKIRHTQSMNGRVEQARQALSMSERYMDAFAKEANAMIEAEVTRQKFYDIVEAIYPKPEKDVKGALTKWTKKVDLLTEIYDSVTVENSYGTAWGAFNALTERIDWFRSPRKGNAEGVLLGSSGMDDVVTTEKNKILSVVKSMAGVS